MYTRSCPEMDLRPSVAVSEMEMEQFHRTFQNAKGLICTYMCTRSLQYLENGWSAAPDTARHRYRMVPTWQKSPVVAIRGMSSMIMNLFHYLEELTELSTNDHKWYSFENLRADGEYFVIMLLPPRCFQFQVERSKPTSEVIKSSTAWIIVPNLQVLLTTGRQCNTTMTKKI